jgi:hypothetical protein
MMNEKQLLQRIAECCEALQITQTEFGKRVLNNPAFVGNVRRGVSPRLKTVNKILTFIEENK